MSNMELSNSLKEKQKGSFHLNKTPFSRSDPLKIPINVFLLQLS